MMAVDTNKISYWWLESSRVSDRSDWTIVKAIHLATDRYYWRTCIGLSQRASASPSQKEEEEEEEEELQWVLKTALKHVAL